LFIEDKKRDSTAADLVALKEKYYTPAQKLFRWLRYRQSSNNFRAVDRILTNSNFSKDELRTTYGVTAQVCYLGVDVAKFRPLQIGRENFLLSVGAVHYHKGYRFLIRSLAQLPEKQRSPLIIAANNSDPAELRILRDLASEKGVNFTVRNIKDADEMVELYNRAVAFVYSPIREPWGLAAVEAMACGTPVVAVGEGGITESIVDGETGLLTPRDEKLFAYALNQVLANPGLAARLGSGGVARVRSHFTWDKTVDRLETHFHELVLEHNAL
jgi:glycosyltransferase involved in cell wall biosynthesis